MGCVDCNFSAPKSREMPDAPLTPHFADLPQIFAVTTPVLPPPPDCRQGRSAPPLSTPLEGTSYSLVRILLL